MPGKFLASRSITGKHDLHAGILLGHLGFNGFQYLGVNVIAMRQQRWIGFDQHLAHFFADLVNDMDGFVLRYPDRHQPVLDVPAHVIDDLENFVVGMPLLRCSLFGCLLPFLAVIGKAQYIDMLLCWLTPSSMNLFICT